MKKIAFLLVALLALPVAAQCVSPTSFGVALPLNEGWLFELSDDSTSASPSLVDMRWQRVRLPHDWSVTMPMSPDCGSCQGYLPGGIGWYRRHLSAEEVSAFSEGKHLYIYFEGVYNRSSVYLNGHLLGYRPSGFSSFLYDLTPHLLADQDNVLAVRVDHSRQNDSRWYTGSGIYRPVWLISAPSTHFALWGTSWNLKSINQKKAVVEVSVKVDTEPTSAERKEAYAIAVEILDAEGHIVASSKKSASTFRSPLSTYDLTIPSPTRWTLTTPYLYKVRARLMENGKEIDRSEVPLGLRTLEFSPNQGFALNGEWMKVKGVCLHDDAGTLGTAVPPTVWKRRLMNLKSLGANAIRMSHNPHAPALYDLCDSLGLLVMDEASDEWEFPKRKWLKGWNQGTPGYEGTFDYFEEWIDRDVADMVRRDRCHPSIFLWSIGNEVDYPNDPYSHPVLDRGGKDFTQPIYGGYNPASPNAERIGIIAQRLSKIVRDIDPTRAVTGALAGVVMSNETAYPEAVDVVGYNYTESRYLEDHQHYPNRVIYGSENRHDFAAWKAVRDNPHIFGQFLWTGIDYLGESGAWPARGSSAGLLDLAGNIKPIGHYRAALWSEQPVCYIGTYPAESGRGRSNRNQARRPQYISPYAAATWNYEEGQRIRVVCYTNAPTAHLQLNGQPIGGEPIRDPATDILYWDIDYAPGTLSCMASNEATASIVTCGRPYTLRVHADKTKLTHPDDVAHVYIEIIDEAGNLVPVADNLITCMVERGRLLGMENGDLSDTSSRRGRQHRAYGGRLLTYIAPGRQGGPVRVQFSTPLLQSAAIELSSTTYSTDSISMPSNPVMR